MCNLMGFNWAHSEGSAGLQFPFGEQECIFMRMLRDLGTRS